MYILSSGVDDGNELNWPFRINRDDEDDSVLNLCGVTKRHSFPLIKFLNLTDNEDYHLMYLVRDPRGNSSIVNYNRMWHKKDPRWTEELLS